MMKVFKKLFFASTVCFAVTASAQQTKVSGDIKGLGDTELSAYYYEGDEQRIDKIKTIGGKFTWNGNIVEAQKVTFIFPGRGVGLYLEPGNMLVTGNIDSLQSLKVAGSDIQVEADAFLATRKFLDDKQWLLSQKYGRASKEEQSALEQEFAAIAVQRKDLMHKYIASHPESLVSLSLATDFASMGNYSDVKLVYDKLGSKIKNTAEGKRIGERLVILKRSSIGEQMLNFTQNDVSDKPVSFNSFKGKYVLIDFWASWCGPCRAENPNVLKVYNTYKDKNFTIIGISLDEKGDNWRKAISDDGMPWTQLSDLKGWKNEVSSYYGIKGIPSTLLVDPQGKIIAKDLRGETLRTKLEDIFGQKSK